MKIKKIIATFLVSTFVFITPPKSYAEAYMLTFFENLDWSGFFDKMEGSFDICSCQIEDTEHFPVGFKLRYVEPIMGITISSIPWHIAGLDLKMDSSLLRKQGTTRGDSDEHFMFKHTNVVIFPILGWTIGLAQDYMCFERGTFLNMVYFSEVDPTYNSDVLGLMTSSALPLSRLWFSNPIAEIASAVDCAQTTLTGKPNNALYYSDGCRGGAYAADTGYTRMGMNIENSETIAFRVISKMHSYGGLVKTSDVGFTQNPTGSNIQSSRCETKYFPTIIKEQYFLQLPYSDMAPLGKMRFHYDFKSKPNDEDAVFFWLWRMRDICIGATQCRSTFTGL